MLGKVGDENSDVDDFLLENFGESRKESKGEEPYKPATTEIV